MRHERVYLAAVRQGAALALQNVPEEQRKELEPPVLAGVRYALDYYLAETERIDRQLRPLANGRGQQLR